MCILCIVNIFHIVILLSYLPNSHLHHYLGSSGSSISFPSILKNNHVHIFIILFHLSFINFTIIIQFNFNGHFPVYFFLKYMIYCIIYHSIYFLSSRIFIVIIFTIFISPFCRVVFNKVSQEFTLL